MPIRSQEKLDRIARLNSHLLQAKAQLPQARTEEERAFLNKKIRILTRLIQAIETRRTYLSILLSELPVRQNRMSGPR
jgi:hypothetical protein